MVGLASALSEPSGAEEPLRTLIDDYIAAQQRLQTPVARFSEVHRRAASQQPAPHLAPVYRDLIPLTAPTPGEHYAFEVDLDSCSGCKACVAGCHSLNGLDEDETWRDVGLLLGSDPALPFQQTVTTSCHHCADPGCLTGCPVLAYEKDPLTGIVRHLDDQCIGCSYCILKCPYDAPKFNARLGIVRKCDMCHGRLSAGEAPACVQACPTHAIRIVKTSSTSSSADPCTFLAGAPGPHDTRPGTRYVSKRPLPTGLRAADEASPRIQPAHTPLAALLLLSQLALGLQLSLLNSNSPPLFAHDVRLSAAWLFAAAGLAASVLHLGQPRRAWRIFLGLRTSWLSREALVLAAWFAALSAQLAWPWMQAHLPVPLPGLGRGIAMAALALGMAGVFCSAMIYIDTPRRAWTAPRTLGMFAGTVALAAVALIAPLTAATLLVCKLVFETAFVLVGPDATRALLLGPLRQRTALRVLTALASTGLLIIGDAGMAAAWLAALVALAAGEALERHLFFAAVDPSKMPGLPTTAAAIV